MRTPTFLTPHLLSFCTLLACVFCPVAYAANAAAPPVDPQIQNLLGRFSDAQVIGGGRLILSYENSNRSFLYDQALAILAFVHADQKTAAEDILKGLGHLQSAQGSWAFQYESVSGHIIPAEETISPSGAIAWVAMAVEAYEMKYRKLEPTDVSRSVDLILEKTLLYLQSHRVPVDWEGKTTRPVVFSPTRNTIVSFEHNVDAYAVFLNAPSNLPMAQENKAAAANIRSYLESMWDSNRFYAGFDTAEGQPNRDEDFLDTQSWGILSLGTTGNQGEDFRRGIATNCTEFQTSSAGGSSGFAFYHPARLHRAPASTSPVWTEGSLGMMFAMRLSQKQDCDGKKLTDYEKSMDLLTQSDGGVPYATESSDPDFSTKSSVAGTAWKYFFNKNFNPFHPSFD